MQALSRRADVVVDDVEDHRQAARVRGVDELLQPERAAVGGLGGALVDAVVAPAARAGELGDRHQLDRRHAELGQRGEVRDRALEGALGRERADVQLVDDAVVQAGGAELAVGPLEGERVDDPRGPAQALGLPARARVGQLDAVEHEHVVVALARRRRWPRRCRSRPARARARRR